MTLPLKKELYYRIKFFVPLALIHLFHSDAFFVPMLFFVLVKYFDSRVVRKQKEGRTQIERLKKIANRLS